VNDLARAEEVARLHEVQVPAPAGHLARSSAAAGSRNSPPHTGQLAEVTRDTLWLNGAIRHDCWSEPSQVGRHRSSQEGKVMTVVTSHCTSMPPSTGLTRRSALRGLGGATVAALLAAGPQADRVMAQAATPGATEPLFSEWAAAWSGDLERVADIYAANFVGDDFASGEHFEGVDAVRSHIETIHAGFPDLKITVNSGFICDNRAALEYVFSGTYSGQPVSIPIAALFELEDGKIVREAHYYDLPS
jgi:steroid delta-isomerase-like uncharacterized protein